MTERNRQHLKQEFEDGERPTGQDFADLMDSTLNKVDDGLQVDAGNLVLSQGLALGSSSRTTAGTLRFEAGGVQFHDGATWVDLASGGAGVFQPVGGTGAVAYDGGNVGIGDLGGPPTFRLEVDLGSNNGEAQRVRFGNAACHNGSAAFQAFAHFSHRDQASNSGYAVRQGPNGDTQVNAASNRPLSLRQNGNQVRLGITNDGNVVVHGQSDLPGSGNAAFQVNGTAFKTSGINWDVPSDLRLKDEVRDLDAGLDELLQVRPVRFRYNGRAGTPAGQEQMGIIGQELEEVFPEMVRRVPTRLDDDGDEVEMRVFEGSGLTFVLVRAVQQLAARLAELEARLGAPADPLAAEATDA